MCAVNLCFIMVTEKSMVFTLHYLLEGHRLRQAQRTDLSPWRQFHNLPEVPSHGSSCTPPGPFAITKTQTEVTQTDSSVKQILLVRPKL